MHTAEINCNTNRINVSVRSKEPGAIQRKGVPNPRFWQADSDSLLLLSLHFWPVSPSPLALVKSCSNRFHPEGLRPGTKNHEFYFYEGNPMPAPPIKAKPQTSNICCFQGCMRGNCNKLLASPSEIIETSSIAHKKWPWKLHLIIWRIKLLVQQVNPS